MYCRSSAGPHEETLNGGDMTEIMKMNCERRYKFMDRNADRGLILPDKLSKNNFAQSLSKLHRMFHKNKEHYYYEFWIIYWAIMFCLALIFTARNWRRLLLCSPRGLLLCSPRGLLCDHIESCGGGGGGAVRMAVSAEAFYTDLSMASGTKTDNYTRQFYLSRDY
jgi:hypothetical protein